MLARHHWSCADEMVWRRAGLAVTCLAMRQTVRAQQFFETDVARGRLTSGCLKDDTTALAHDSTRVRHLSYLCQSLALDLMTIEIHRPRIRGRYLPVDLIVLTESYVGRKSLDLWPALIQVHRPREHPLLEPQATRDGCR